jgi:hypothetical protein
LHGDGNGNTGREGADSTAAGAGTAPVLRRLAGGAEPPPRRSVALRREWKGSTLAMQRREGNALGALPGIRRRTLSPDAPPEGEAGHWPLHGRVLSGPFRPRPRSGRWRFWLAIGLGGSAIALCSLGG